jgi:hypothetical protein
MVARSSKIKALMTYRIGDVGMVMPDFSNR